MAGFYIQAISQAFYSIKEQAGKLYSKYFRSALVLSLFVTFAAAFIVSGCFFPSYSNIIAKRIDLNKDFVNYYIIPGSRIGQKNENLIIYLDGSSWGSALGVKGMMIPWRKVTMAMALHKNLSKSYDLLVPEKLNYEMGKEYEYDYKNDRFDNPRIVSEYTLSNRVLAARTVIDSFLKTENYRNVVILGFSEGALILPKVYNELKQKNKITGLINVSYGGMSYAQVLEEQAKNDTAFRNYLASAFEKIKNNPDAIDKHAFGWPLKKWSDFMWYEPLSDYKNINIPILLIHGVQDKNVSVESARYLVREFEKLGKYNLFYHEVNDNHSLNNSVSLIKEIENWIISIK